MAFGNSRGGFRSGGSRGGFRGGSRGGFGGGFKREMTKIKCSQCGKEDEVPFKPREGTPVYCKDCYFKQKGIEPRSNSFGEKKAESKPVAEEDSNEDFGDDFEADDSEEA